MIDPNSRIPRSITEFHIFREVKVFPGVEIVNTVPATRNSYE